jgi:elongation factor Ts
MTEPDVAIPAKLVKELRERTGAGMMDCKQALTEAKGDLEKAVILLRKKGIAVAHEKAARVASEGVIGSYIHAGGKMGVVVEVNCETDFVARNVEFQELAHDLAMHICAANPRFIHRGDVTPDILERERQILHEQANASGKPPAVIEKIVDGRMDKFYAETCLYEQPFIRDEKITIKELIDSKTAKFREKIAVRRFVRFKVGEETASYAATKPAAASRPEGGSAPGHGA